MVQAEGAVVVCGRRRGVVVASHGSRLAIAPVVADGVIRAGDVAVAQLDDMLTLSAEDGAVVRLAWVCVASARDQQQVGRVSVSLWRALCQARRRWLAESSTAERWRDVRLSYEEHLQGERCVKL